MTARELKKILNNLSEDELNLKVVYSYLSINSQRVRSEIKSCEVLYYSDKQYFRKKDLTEYLVLE